MMSNAAKSVEIQRTYKEIWAAYCDGCGGDTKSPHDGQTNEEIEASLRTALAVAQLADPDMYGALALKSYLFLANAMVNAGYRIVKS